MKSIIRKLHDQVIGDMDLRKGEIGKLLQEVSEKEEALLRVLSDEGKEVFDEFMTSYGDLNGEIGFEKFTAGFVLGGRIMLEMLCYLEEDE